MPTTPATPATLDVTQLSEQVESLRQQVALLQQQVQRPQVVLQASRPAPFLGQTVMLSGTVTDAAGTPQIGVSVVVATTWGRLQSRDRLLTEQGTSLVVTTGAEGRFSLDLLPATSEDLLAVQQEALEQFLARLDATAPTPRQTEADLREMAHLYQWDVNHAYRQALDIYFRDFGDGLLESVNVRDYLQQWDYLEATVTAYLPKPGSTTVESLGVMMVPFKQWLGPWLEVFLTVSQAQNPLPNILVALETTSQFGNLQEGVYRQVGNYIDQQSGLVGAYIGRKVVENTLQSFLLEGSGDGDVAVRAILAPALKTASTLLASGGVSGLQSVVQTRRDLKLEVGTQIESSGLAVGDLTERVAGIATQVSGLQTTVGSFDGRVGAIATQVSGLQTTVSTVDGRVGQITTQLGSVQSSLGTITGRVNTLQTRFGQFDSQVGGLSTEVGGLRDQVGRFSQFETNIAGLNERVEGLQGRFTQLGTRLEQIQGNVGGLTTRLTDIQGSFDRLDASTTSRFTQLGTRLGQVEGRVTVGDNRFDTVVGRIDTLDRTIAAGTGDGGQFSDRLASQDKLIATLQERTQATDSLATQLNQDVVGLQQDTLGLNRRINQVNVSVDGLQRNVNGLDTQISGLDGRVTAVQGGMTTLTTRVGSLDSQVGGMGRDVSRLNASVGTLQTSFNQVNTQVSTVTGQVGRLETNVSTLDGRFTGLTGQVGGLERNLTNLNRVSNDRIGLLENSVSRVGNNVLSLRTDLNR